MITDQRSTLNVDYNSKIRFTKIDLPRGRNEAACHHENSTFYVFYPIMPNIVQYWTLLFDPKKDRFLDPSLLIDLEMLRCKTIKNKVASLD